MRIITKDAKEYLNSLLTIDEDINSRLIERETMIKTMIGSPTFNENKVQESRNGSYDDKYLKVLELGENINEQIDKLYQMRNEATKMIDLVGNVNKNYMIILRCRYLAKLSWDEISDIMQYSHKHVFKLHGQALNEFRKVYAEVTLGDGIRCY